MPVEEIPLSEALETLANAFGSTLETGRTRGLELMRATLADEHDLPEGAASEVVAALETSGGIAWVTQAASVEGPRSVSPLSERPVASTIQNAPGALPVEGGYWQIGEARSRAR